MGLSDSYKHFLSPIWGIKRQVPPPHPSLFKKYINRVNKQDFKRKWLSNISLRWKIYVLFSQSRFVAVFILKDTAEVLVCLTE